MLLGVSILVASPQSNQLFHLSPPEILKLQAVQIEKAGIRNRQDRAKVPEDGRTKREIQLRAGDEQFGAGLHQEKGGDRTATGRADRRGVEEFRVRRFI